MLTLIATGMSIGFSASTSCTAVCFPILIPYLASQSSTRILGGLKTVLLFSAGRLISYMALGIIVAWIMGSMNISPLMTPIVTIILSLVLVLHGLNTLGAFNFSQRPIAKACRGISSGKPHFIMGLLVGLRPCVPLLAALMYTVNLSSIFEVMVFMLCFGIASSLLVIAFGVAGRGFINLLVSRIGLERMRRLSGLVLVILGAFFLLQGIGGVIHL
ncbi:MAG: sulfite exporter TauE/SafE family protein [Dehalococcoidales bacterium]|jgi:sulfite exporter TauE/SafE|nr:sulfite exporter TauE/SafE family protein [Dehalococcoidales bacterium]MDX9986093.1 sulfite exporter TauE/SafE family protein [Dehalococcoidales bacterium]NLE90204.1 sulfite exporter TauE/SafE family protein [Dehalococcoidales bacterium]